MAPNCISSNVREVSTASIGGIVRQIIHPSRAGVRGPSKSPSVIPTDGSTVAAMSCSSPSGRIERQRCRSHHGGAPYSPHLRRSVGRSDSAITSSGSSLVSIASMAARALGTVEK